MCQIFFSAVQFKHDLLEGVARRMHISKLSSLLGVLQQQHC
jgi:hypothetical protein